MKPFLRIYDDLKPDGALRDFYIENTNSNHWNIFISIVFSLVQKMDFIWGGCQKEFPSSFQEVKELQNKQVTTLSTWVSDNQLNCHFFCEDEIEIDFEPNDFRDPKSWSELIQFFQSVVNAIGLRGIITQENYKEYLIEEIEPEQPG